MRYQVKQTGTSKHFTTAGHVPAGDEWSVIDTTTDRPVWAGSNKDTAHKTANYLSGNGWTR